jgi:SPP1 gp7 family putative phage head morphogenesis protein
MQRGTGLAFDFAGIPTQTIEEILRNPWNGKHFSKRIWGNSEVVAKKLGEIAVAGLMQGKPILSMQRELMEFASVASFAANRLLRTEMNYMANAGEMASYEGLGLDRYRYLATLDSRTSKPCQNLDMKVFLVKDAMPGENMPPLHPFCRSTTIAVIGDEELGDLTRRARNPETGRVETVRGDVSYREWRGKLPDLNDKATEFAFEKKLNAKKELFSNLVQTEKELQSDTSLDFFAKYQEREELIQQLADNAAELRAMQPDSDDMIAQVIQRLPTFDVSDNDTRIELARQFIDELGIDRSNVIVDFDIQPIGYGRCELVGLKPVEFGSYYLTRDDERDPKYRLKTVYHEAYHLFAQGGVSDYGNDEEKWRTIEEAFTESASHYAARLSGYPDLHPSYSKILIETLPRLKRFDPEFSDCTNISDFGKIAWKRRFASQNAIWVKYYDELYSQPFDDKAYAMQYLPYIEQHQENLVDRYIENDPRMKNHKQRLLDLVSEIVGKLKQNNGMSKLDPNSRDLFYELAVQAICDKGVY